MTTIQQIFAFKTQTLICTECGSVMFSRPSDDGHCTIAYCTALHCAQRRKVGKIENERVELIATDESEFSGRDIEQEIRVTVVAPPNKELE